MSVFHGSVTVGATATRVTPVAQNSERYSDDRSTISIQNSSSADVFLGGVGVTTTSYGYKLPAGADFVVDVVPSDSLFAIVATGTATLRLLTVRS